MSRSIDIKVNRWCLRYIILKCAHKDIKILNFMPLLCPISQLGDAVVLWHMAHNFVMCLAVYGYKKNHRLAIYVSCNLHDVSVANNFAKGSMQNCIYRLTVVQTWQTWLYLRNNVEWREGGRCQSSLYQVQCKGQYLQS